MLKRTIWAAMAAILLVWQLCAGSVAALELTEEIRTLPYNEEGEQVIYSLQQLERGKSLFNNVCSQCHVGGITKTNPNVNLALPVLNGAEPPRDNVVALVDYMEYPTTYDGESDLLELHPNTTRSDLWAEMRNLTDEDLEHIGAHILFQPRVRGRLWGGGKTLN
ncbi:cytochrome c-550 [Rubidibacter lacunae KORDI 51-2]|uniref:Photosystem II extrinsic protein V n=1 Tax=Rubidibacter lacunae KORDI 51-2 TaxID=582515 RepID=U5DNN7_9CHRO|nr:photosystem II cytochrome c-550 [Rubidibacter lacunae]ERN41320.1 cytochrome c-550 [Rubidibacter lacunae KORDI 51-2]